LQGWLRQKAGRKVPLFGTGVLVVPVAGVGTIKADKPRPS
jgi:hypothetical protein